MKFNIVIIFVLTLLISSCKSNQEPIKTKEVKLKKNVLIGTIIFQEEKLRSRNYKPRKELYFKVKEKEYFIKISEGYLTHEKLLTYENKLIKIKGEIKVGEWEKPKSISIVNPTPRNPRSGEYITIEKIYKN